MKNPFVNTTRLKWLCLKALGLLIASLIGMLCAHFKPANGQSIQAMVKNQPFPYKTGVAQDSALYATIKAKLQAADQLRTNSRKAVDSLQLEIKAAKRALSDRIDLNRFDKAVGDTLQVRMQTLQTTLSSAQQSIREADQVFEQLLAELPRNIRKALGTPSADQLARAVVDYIHLLQHRKWNWAGIASASGVLIGLLTRFL